MAYPPPQGNWGAPAPAPGTQYPPPPHKVGVHSNDQFFQQNSATPQHYSPTASPYAQHSPAPGQQPMAAPYGAPPQGQYGAPPPGQHGAPPPGQYGAPPPGQYGAPPPGQYGAPPPGQYGAPPPGQHGAPPAGQYGAPPGAHGPPGAAPYGGAPPAGQYGAPPGAQPPYGAPPGAHGAPGAQPYGGAPPYGAPPGGQPPYGAPLGTHGTPGAQPYGAPVGQPVGPPGANGPSKKAVCIGINYIGDPKAKLSGCINDANCMEYLLQKKFQFPASGIVKLVDDSKDPNLRPTRKNILNALAWLVKDTKPGDVRWFSYSGHGSQVRDTSGDEADGFDETICPADFRTAGMIIDDLLFTHIVKPIPAGAKLISVMDCCHSGTGLDLPYSYEYQNGRFMKSIETGPGASSGGKKKKKKKPKVKAPPKINGHCVLFSGCADHQTSADTKTLSGGTFTGAMSFAFIQTIEKSYPNLTYASLIQQMYQVVKSKKFTQNPMLSSGNDMDLNTPFQM